MKIITIKIPVEKMIASIQTVRGYREQVLKLNQMIRELGTESETRAKSGSVGVEKRAKALELAESLRQDEMNAVISTLAEQQNEANSEIDVQVTPNGMDIVGENAGDFALMEHGLIDSAEHLERILAKHDNPAFRIAAAKYADKRNWEGFEFLNKEKAVRDYIDQVYQGLIEAVHRIDGYAALQYIQTPGEYERMATAYGLADEFTASNGERIAATLAEEYTDVAAQVGDNEESKVNTAAGESAGEGAK